MPNTIAVGVDGSEASLIALRWALNAAAVRGADLLAVIAGETGRETSGSTTRRATDGANQVVATCRAITDIADGRPVRIEQLPGSPTEVLLAVSGRVDLLVVGGHGYGGWRDHFTPSVTGQLAIRTKAAVCVVRAIAPQQRHRIVVGYDVRSGAAAVQFAIAEAALRKASTLIVSTWQYPRDTRATSPEPADILEQGAAAVLAELARELRLAHPGAVIDTVVRFGHPVDVLAGFADSADMVVIGCHQHRGMFPSRLPGRGLTTLVVGSVAIDLLRRVATPVTIVPHAG